MLTTLKELNMGTVLNNPLVSVAKKRVRPFSLMASTEVLRQSIEELQPAIGTVEVPPAQRNPQRCESHQLGASMWSNRFMGYHP